MKSKLNRKIFKKLTPFVLVLAVLYGTFAFGYLQGQKGRSVFGLAPQKIVNTEVGKPEAVDFSLFWEAWNKLQRDSVFETNAEAMLYASISGLLSSVNDPYTTFFTPEDNERFLDDIKGHFDGIGVELLMKNGQPTVVAPLSDSPAAKAGMRAGDVIVKVDSVESSTLGFNEIIDKIRGLKGSTVELEVAREGADKLLTFTIVRDTITVDSVSWEEKTSGGKRIMHVKVRQFGDDTDRLFADFVAAVKKSKPDGLVLDLRNNPGGYFESAIDMASYFVDDGLIVQQKDKDGKQTDFSTTRKAELKDFPTVVLVNAGSASASEIVSGALQDRKAATLIGEKTFGKGSVQELVNLSNGSAVKITIASWLTPNGRQINKEGIAPDIEVKEGDDLAAELQLQRAFEYLVNGK